jgi:NAD(P)-dependent dehydrogenase (short-subunit alcohol dehydrogenase family)
MGALDGRVAVITGAGRGLGRTHALLFAAEGASVVVNDIDPDPVADVVAEINAAGGRAVPNTDDVADWDGGRRAVEAAVEAFGVLHVLVNNAGILQDRALANMTEEEWDEVIRVHLKGHFVPTRWAAAYWREESRDGRELHASVINTSSTSGLIGNPGQANYGAAKAGIAAFTVIVSQELARYDVRVNAVAPQARTRLTEGTPGLGEVVAAPAGDAFDIWDPANASPLVAYLATAEATETGCVYFVHGDQIRIMQPWALGPSIDRRGRWTVDELATELPKLRT